MVACCARVGDLKFRSQVVHGFAQKIIAENAVYSPRVDIAPPQGQPALSEVKLISESVIRRFIPTQDGGLRVKSCDGPRSDLSPTARPIYRGEGSSSEAIRRFCNQGLAGFQKARSNTKAGPN